MTNEAGMRLSGGWRTIIGVCGAAAATGLLVTTSAAADLVTRVAPSQDLSARAAQERSAAYWTPKRMAAAQPRGLKRVSSAELDHMARSDGPSGRVEPRRTVSPAAIDRALPTAFGTYEIFEYAVRPNTANGKIFGTDRSGDFECSGDGRQHGESERGLDSRSLRPSTGLRLGSQRGFRSLLQGWGSALRRLDLSHRGGSEELDPQADREERLCGDCGRRPRQMGPPFKAPSAVMTWPGISLVIRSTGSRAIPATTTTRNG